jgi:hypothetical protein
MRVLAIEVVGNDQYPDMMARYWWSTPSASSQPVHPPFYFFIGRVHGSERDMKPPIRLVELLQPDLQRAP